MQLIKDVCIDCKEEKDGFYDGDYDNPYFICQDCDTLRKREEDERFKQLQTGCSHNWENQPYGWHYKAICKKCLKIQER